MQSKGVVLLVEHNRMLRNINRDALRDTGYAVHTAGCAAEAREALERLEPDVVLLDVDLPDEDGFDLCREIWNETTARIVLLTSGSGREANFRALFGGADASFPKPYKLRHVLSSVERQAREGKRPPPADKLPPWPFGVIPEWAAAGRQPTVLLIGEDRRVTETAARALERKGYACRHAPSGGAARTILAELEPDVILLDTVLPDGDGPAFCGQIRDSTNAEILLLSEKILRSHHMARCGADGFLRKPFYITDLFARLERALSRRLAGKRE